MATVLDQGACRRGLRQADGRRDAPSAVVLFVARRLIDTSGALRFVQAILAWLLGQSTRSVNDVPNWTSRAAA